MKRCAYCGARYPDEVMQCWTDGQPLLLVGADGTVVPAPVAAGTPGTTSEGLSPNSIEEPKPKSLDVIYPGYHASARDGWKFLGLILVIQFVLVNSPSVLFA